MFWISERGLCGNIFIRSIGGDIFIGALRISSVPRQLPVTCLRRLCRLSFYLWSSWAPLITAAGAEYVSYACLAFILAPFPYAYWAICSKLLVQQSFVLTHKTWLSCFVLIFLSDYYAKYAWKYKCIFIDLPKNGSLPLRVVIRNSSGMSLKKRKIFCVFVYSRNNFSNVFSFERSVQKLLLVISAVWAPTNYELGILSLMRIKCFRDSP